MDAPKISILIPMYNRKHYIEQCIDSVLIQTFQDFEIVVRDDGSTDGSAEFVEERYAAEISAEKIRLKRNGQNLGENPTVIRLFLDAAGKYFAVLHSDDMYLPHALQYLYETAEKFSADIVHTIRFLKSPPGGVIKHGTPLQVMSPETQKVDEVTVMPDDQFARFKEFFLSSNFFGDIQYTFFRRDFVLDNKILLDTRGSYLHWLFLAKVYVKTPEVYYVRRDAPDSITRSGNRSKGGIFSIEFLEKSLTKLIEDGADFERLDEHYEIFKKFPEFKYIMAARVFNVMTSYYVKGREYYRDGYVSEEVRAVVERVFKKYFGVHAAYPIFLFHLINFLPFIPSFERVFVKLPAPESSANKP